MWEPICMKCLPRVHRSSWQSPGGRESRRQTFILQPANVLRGQELEGAAVHFGDKAFAVCNEGLLPYLTMEEKATMAQNLRDLLRSGSGCWITTDVAFKGMRERMFRMLGTRGRATGRQCRTFPAHRERQRSQ